jgi:hypothetical protein
MQATTAALSNTLLYCGMQLAAVAYILATAEKQETHTPAQSLLSLCLDSRAALFLRVLS